MSNYSKDNHRRKKAEHKALRRQISRAHGLDLQLSSHFHLLFLFCFAARASFLSTFADGVLEVRLIIFPGDIAQDSDRIRIRETSFLLHASFLSP